MIGITHLIDKEGHIVDSEDDLYSCFYGEKISPIEE